MNECNYCHDTRHDTESHFVEAFRNPVTREGYCIPDDLREAAIRICRSYRIGGICDPMYVANVIAVETGRGDGQSHFTAPAVR